MRDDIIQRMAAQAADMRENTDRPSTDEYAEDLLDTVEEFLGSLSENATPPGLDRYASPMRVRASQVMLDDVVVFHPTPGSTDPYLGTVYAMQALNSDVELKFYGPQSQEREVLIGGHRQVSIVRMVERP